MRYSQSIRFKVMLLVVVPLLCVAIVYIGVSMFTANKQISDNNIVVSESTEQTVFAIVEEWKTSTLNYAKIVADNPSEQLVNAIQQANTTDIISLMHSAFEYSECDGMTFTDMDGIALARVTNPEKFGDNIKSSLAIADALTGKSVSYVYPTTNNGFSITAGVPIRDDSGAQIGVLFLSKRLDKDATLKTLEYLSGCDIVIFQYDTAVMSSVGDSIYQVNSTLDSSVWQSLQALNGVSASTTIGGQKIMERYIPIQGRDDEVVGAILTLMRIEQDNWIVLMWGIIFVVSFIILYPMISRAITKIVIPIRIISDIAKQLARGDLSAEVQNNRTDEIGVLQQSMQMLAVNMQKQAEIIGNISEGDLTDTFKPTYETDVVGNSLVKMLDNNNAMLKEIHNAAEQLSYGSAQIASGAQTLAAGSTQQAATIEGLRDDILKVLTQTKENSHNANKTLNLVNRAGIEMQETTKHMEELEVAMSGVLDSSEKISKVIKVIDDIAFQTNILALNAAVEAARAGQHGKGFAVVADEVRNLANKSADAAKETAELIQASLTYVQSGSELTNKTSHSVEQVADTAKQAQESIFEINEASQHQEEAIDRINYAIDNISIVVQANSATAEESAAASEELSGQSQMLKQLVAQFRIKDSEYSPAFLSNSPYIQPSDQFNETAFTPSGSDDQYGKY